MISRTYMETMAAYNRWQNESLYGASANLSDDERRADRGAFFGSIHETLSHLLWGNKIWLSRFGAGVAARKASIADSVEECPDWDEMVRERQAVDQQIIAWAKNFDETALDEDLSWFSGAVGREVSKPLALLITHFFNHQTHHRGQVHAMLTAAGQKPDDTDLPFKPEGET
ncbi:MAG: damage-inducible protein DinB [Alphaproteobacteria bacterium]|nr:damage-inducible protein DinB [Alphaproteobacteria bacterium]